MSAVGLERAPLDSYRASDRYITRPRLADRAHVVGYAYSDEDTWEKPRSQIYKELCDLAASLGVDRSSLLALLTMKPEGGNAGTGMTQAIKWCVKYHRARGVHVTPTVHVNGLVRTRFLTHAGAPVLCAHLLEAICFPWYRRLVWFLAAGLVPSGSGSSKLKVQTFSRAPLSNS